MENKTNITKKDAKNLLELLPSSWEKQEKLTISLREKLNKIIEEVE